MSLPLDETCTHYQRTVTKGKIDKESWSEGYNFSCRKLTRESSAFNLEKTQSATRIRTRMMLPASFPGVIRDRLKHNGRMYEIIEVIAARRVGSVSHLVAVCDAVA